ncbi:MAG TPA: hypothetical protein VGH28_20205 [Polyangiaceae bacterium]
MAVRETDDARDVGHVRGVAAHDVFELDFKSCRRSSRTTTLLPSTCVAEHSSKSRI